MPQPPVNQPNYWDQFKESDPNSNYWDQFKESQPEESTASKVWNFLNKPVQPSPVMEKAIEESSPYKSFQSFKQTHPYLGTAADFALHVPLAMATPLGGALAATGGASALASRFGSPALASAMQIPGKIAAGGMMLQGGMKALSPSSTGPERLGGLLEGGLGILGFRGGSESPVEQPKLPPQAKVPEIQAPPQIPEVPPELKPTTTQFAPTPELAPKVEPPDWLKNLQFQDVKKPFQLTPEERQFVDQSGGTGQLTVDPNAIPESSQTLSNLISKFGADWPSKVRDISNYARKYADIPTEEQRSNWDAQAENSQNRTQREGAAATKLYNDIVKEFPNPEAPEALAYTKTPVYNPMIRADIIRRIREKESTQQQEQPQFARVSPGKAQIGVNVARSAEELTSGYSTPLPGIMVREGLQNAFDATEALKEGGNHDIEIGSNEDGTRFIKIGDNGKGMSPEELETVYTNLHETGKADEAGAKGGKGVGKAPYMLGGSHFEVTTVKEINGKKIQSSFSGTPAELMEPFDIASKEVPKDTPTGTTFKTTLNRDQSGFDARSMLMDIKKWSRDVPGKIIEEEYGSKIDSKIPSSKDDLFITSEPIDSGNSNVKLSIPKDTEMGKRSNLMLRVLNKGMYQYSKPMYLNEEFNGIPKDVIIDVNPLVKEGNKNYPFPVQRESLKESVQNEIEQLINDKLVKPLGNRKKIDLKRLWDSLPRFTVMGTKKESVFFDPGNRLTPEELMDFQTSPIMHNLAYQMDNLISSILEKSGHPEWQTGVKRTGFTLDPNMYGVHIPNPTIKGQSAILLNPFQHFSGSNPKTAALNTVVTGLHEAAHVGSENPTVLPKIEEIDLTDPRVGQYLQTYLKEALSQGGIDMGHGIGFIHRLGELYARFGTKSALSAADAIEKAVTDPRTGNYRPEFQELLRAYQESRGREPVTEDILSGTGTKQTNRGPEGERDISGNDRSIREGAITKLRDAITSGGLARARQDVINATEHSSRAKEMESVHTEGQKGFYERLGRLKGEFPKVQGDKLNLSQEDVDSLFTAINKATTIRPYEKINAGTALMKLLGGVAPGKYELKLLDNLFGDDFSQIVEMHGGLGQGVFSNTNWHQLVNEAVNLPKSFMASFDLSAPLRQGLPFISKKQYWNAFGEMFKYAGSQKAYDGLREYIDNRPLASFAEDSGLATRDPASISNREEAFISHWAESGAFLKEGLLREAYSKTAGAIVRGSDRAYTGFLHKLRADVFDDLVTKAQKAGILTDDLGRQIADFVNTATGRGSLGRYEKNAVDLNTALFSPRMMASRVKILKWAIDPRTYINQKDFIRQQQLKALLSVAGFGLTMTSLAQLNGYKVNLDPANSDFMKVKIGNTRFDPWAGFQQYIVAAYRFLSGRTESSNTGKDTYANTGQFNSPSRLDTLFSSSPYKRGALENKMSPLFSFADDLFKGTMEGGTQPFGMKKELESKFIPMVVQDLMDVAKTDPDLLPAAAVAGTFGMGVQSYTPTPMTFKRKSFQRTLSLR